MVDLSTITAWFKTEIAENLIVFSQTATDQRHYLSYTQFFEDLANLKADVWYIVTDWQPGNDTTNDSESETDFESVAIYILKKCGNDDFQAFIDAQQGAKEIYYKQLLPRMKTRRSQAIRDFNFLPQKNYTIEENAAEGMSGISIEFTFKSPANYPVNPADEIII